MGCFKYSPVDGARANALDGAVPSRSRKTLRPLYGRAAAISTARLARRVGQRAQVLIDRVSEGVAYGRTAGDAPEIDGVVRIPASRGNSAGGIFPGDDRTRPTPTILRAGSVQR